MTDVAPDVIAIIAKKASPPRSNLEFGHRLDELGIDSIQLVEMIFDLEEKFDIEIPYNANSSFSDFRTVGDVVGAIQKLVVPKSMV